MLDPRGHDVDAHIHFVGPETYTDPIPDLEAVLMSTHNLCFGAKIRKIGIPLHTPVFLYKKEV